MYSHTKSHCDTREWCTGLAYKQHSTLKQFRVVAQNRTSWTWIQSHCCFLIYYVSSRKPTFSHCVCRVWLRAALCQNSFHIVWLHVVSLEHSSVASFYFIFSNCSLCQPAALLYWSAFPFLLSMEAIRQTSDYAITCYKALYRCVWTGCDGISVSPRHCSLYWCMYLHCTNVSQLD